MATEGLGLAEGATGRLIGEGRAVGLARTEGPVEGPEGPVEGPEGPIEEDSGPGELAAGLGLTGVGFSVPNLIASLLAETTSPRADASLTALGAGLTGILAERETVGRLGSETPAGLTVALNESVGRLISAEIVRLCIFQGLFSD